jgi:lysophospholipase L1-like esterase
LILNVSIKPSFERQHELAKIKEINTQLGEKTAPLPNVQQVDFYDSFIENNRIKKAYFLQDGLHLDAMGYQILKQAIDKKLQQFI